jgi:hypothetical protein
MVVKMKHSMFTIKGWVMLPFALILRIPFALLSWVFELIAIIFDTLSKYSKKIMDKMPSVEYNEDFLAERSKLTRETFLRRNVDDYEGDWSSK